MMNKVIAPMPVPVEQKQTMFDPDPQLQWGTELYDLRQLALEINAGDNLAVMKELAKEVSAWHMATDGNVDQQLLKDLEALDLGKQSAATRAPRLGNPTFATDYAPSALTTLLQTLFPGQPGVWCAVAELGPTPEDEDVLNCLSSRLFSVSLVLWYLRVDQCLDLIRLYKLAQSKEKCEWFVRLVEIVEEGWPPKGANEAEWNKLKNSFADPRIKHSQQDLTKPPSGAVPLRALGFSVVSLIKDVKPDLRKAGKAESQMKRTARAIAPEEKDTDVLNAINNEPWAMVQFASLAAGKPMRLKTAPWLRKYLEQALG